MGHGSRGRLAETCGSNPSRLHEPTDRRPRRIENGLSSTSRQRQAERRLQVLGNST